MALKQQGKIDGNAVPAVESAAVIWWPVQQSESVFPALSAQIACWIACSILAQVRVVHAAGAEKYINAEARPRGQRKVGDCSESD